MAEDFDVVIRARQANVSLQEAVNLLHLTRNRALDAIGQLTVINSGNLANAIAAIRVGVREIEGQLLQFEIASREIDAYRSHLE